MPAIGKMVDKTRMKRHNMRLVFNTIHRNLSASRPQLAKMTGMSEMSAGRIVDALIQLGLLYEAESEGDLGQGRPAAYLHVRRETLQCLGVALETDGFHLTVTDPYGSIVYRRFHPLDVPATNVDSAIEQLIDILDTFMTSYSGQLMSVIGVVAPGNVDADAGMVDRALLLRWQGVGLGIRLQKRFPSYSFCLDRNINARILAEYWFGVLAAHPNAAALSIGDDISAAAIQHGRLCRGEDNRAGDVGHITVTPSGCLCPCGKTGCLQTLLADWAVVRDARTIAPDIALDGIFAAQKAGASWAEAILSRMVQSACTAIDLLTGLYAPGALLLCGSTVDRYPSFRSRIQANYSASNGNLHPALVFSTFESDGNGIGAAAIAFEKALDLSIGTLLTLA